MSLKRLGRNHRGENCPQIAQMVADGIRLRVFCDHQFDKLMAGGSNGSNGCVLAIGLWRLRYWVRDAMSAADARALASGKPPLREKGCWELSRLWETLFRDRANAVGDSHSLALVDISPLRERVCLKLSQAAGTDAAWGNAMA